MSLLSSHRIPACFLILTGFLGLAPLAAQGALEIEGRNLRPADPDDARFLGVLARGRFVRAQQQGTMPPGAAALASPAPPEP